MWLHHHIRFIVSAEMCSLWTPFGGIAAQLNHLTVILTLATPESAGFAIRYHELLIRTLSDHARARLPFDYFTALSEIHDDTRRAISTDGARASVPASTNNAQRNPKGQQRQRNGKNGKQTQKGQKTGKGKKGRDGQAGKGKGPTPLTTAPPPTVTG